MLLLYEIIVLRNTMWILKNQTILVDIFPQIIPNKNYLQVFRGSNWFKINDRII